MEENSGAQTKIPFEFHGRGGEYFGIWIVNILLTIITFGLYSPWAKVRSKRYFYGRTTLNSSSFAYLADPLAILKGWLIAVIIFALYSATSSFVPLLEIVFILLFLIALPLLIVRSMAFRARNSAWQNIRFDFKGRYGEAVKIFILWGILGFILSLGLLFPYIQYRQTRFLIENSAYGKSDFEFKANTSDFYIIYLIAMGIVTLFSIAIGVMMSLGVVGIMSQSPDMVLHEMDDPQAVMGAFQFIMLAAMFLMYFGLFAYVQSRVGNLVWSNIHIKGNSLQSSLRARDLLWIYFSNLAAIIVSFGLLVPWAKVRTVRYRLSKLQLMASDNLDQFIQAEQEKISALGEEVGEVFDIDIGL